MADRQEEADTYFVQRYQEYLNLCNRVTGLFALARAGEASHEALEKASAPYLHRAAQRLGVKASAEHRAILAWVEHNLSTSPEASARVKNLTDALARGANPRQRVEVPEAGERCPRCHRDAPNKNGCALCNFDELFVRVDHAAVANTQRLIAGKSEVEVGEALYSLIRLHTHAIKGALE